MQLVAEAVVAWGEALADRPVVHPEIVDIPEEADGQPVATIVPVSGHSEHGHLLRVRVRGKVHVLRTQKGVGEIDGVLVSPGHAGGDLPPRVLGLRWRRPCP